MANKTISEQVIEEKIIQVPLEEVMPNSMMPYAEHVILERALPRVEDGLKPVQRRILYTMKELSLSPDKPHRKCARIVGDCLGKFHPHGDSSVYEALVRMAQPYSLRGLLVDGHGNFGSIDGDSAAAMRYTEARMAPLAMLMLQDIEKDTVPFCLNFDDTLKEPEILPSRYPNLLVNGSSGIAVGLATNIPPHNLKETIDATCLLLDNQDATLEDIMQVMPAPDFPTGGVLIETDELKKAYQTGRGKLTLRAKIEIEKGSAGRTLLVIKEVPYMVSKAQMLEKILRLSQEKKNQLSAIYDIRDESDRTGLRAVIELRKDTDIEKTLAILYKYSDLQVTFGVNMFSIAQGKPELMGVKKMLQYFIEHQKNVVTRRTQYDLDNAQKRAHILEGLIVAVDNLDEIIRLIRKSKNAKEAKERLIERFSFSDVQAQAILDLRLQRLTGLEILALKKEYEDLLKLIDKLNAILKSERKLLNVIKKELLEISDAYKDERRTLIVHESHIKDKDIKEEAPLPEETVVVYTKGGQLKRFFKKTYEKMDKQIEENDTPLYIFDTETDRTLYFFTDQGNCYPLSVSVLQECRPKDRGVTLSGVLQGLTEEEKLIKIMCFKSDDLKTMPSFIFVTKKGFVKRTECTQYDVRRARFAALTLKDNDLLHDILIENDDKDVLLITKEGMAIRFRIDQIPLQGRTSTGVKGMKIDLADELILSTTLSNEGEILLMTEKGYGKSIPCPLFDLQGRAGKGVKCIAFNKNTSTGAYLATAVKITKPVSVIIEQQTGTRTLLPTDVFPVQSLAEKGKIIVVAILDDIVTTMKLQTIEEGQQE